MLTDDEVALASHAYALRHDEGASDLWLCPGDDLFVAARRLWERGYLQRRWCGENLVFRLSDEAMTAQELTQLISGASQN